MSSVASGSRLGSLRLCTDACGQPRTRPRRLGGLFLAGGELLHGRKRRRRRRGTISTRRTWILLRSRGVDVSGLERVAGRTFHWSGVYSAEDVNERKTLDTQLNVFAEFTPSLSESHRQADTVFLANIDPSLQLDVLGADGRQAPNWRRWTRWTSGYSRGATIWQR